MGRVFTDGAESGDALFWDFSPPTNVNTFFRISGRSYDIVSPLSEKSVPATSEFFFHVALQPNNANQLSKIAWRNNTTELGSIRRTANNTIDIYTGTSTLQVTGALGTFLADQWIAIDLHVKIDNANGVIEFKQDGVLQPGFTGDTQPGADTTVNRIGLAAVSASIHLYADDLAFNDTSGVIDNSWIDDFHLYSLIPDGNGDSSQLVGADANSTDNYAQIDDVPSDGDTTYVESATSGNKDLYTLSNLPTLPAGATINRVLIETRARELMAEGNSINLGVKSGTTEQWSDPFVTPTSFARQAAEFLVDPNTSVAWTEAGVNAMQAGVKIT